MRLNYNCFEKLRIIAEGCIASVDITSNDYLYLVENEYISDCHLTRKGEELLESHRVDNAIILAAGMGSRFRPFSYHMPKSLAKLKGEVLIERQIRQLKEKNIDDIIIVVGYMADKFNYLQEKYNVRLVYNPDYEKCNNISSFYAVRDELKNSYVLGADYWFASNIFNKYEFDSYYARVYSDKYVDEYCITLDDNGYINNITKGGDNTWYTVGEIFFSRNLSELIRQDLENEYKDADVKQMIIDIYCQKHIEKYKFFTKERESDLVYEFDSMSEAIQFDSTFSDYAEKIIKGSSQ